MTQMRNFTLEEITSRLDQGVEKEADELNVVLLSKPATPPPKPKITCPLCGNQITKEKDPVLHHFRDEHANYTICYIENSQCTSQWKLSSKLDLASDVTLHPDICIDWPELCLFYEKVNAFIVWTSKVVEGTFVTQVKYLNTPVHPICKTLKIGMWTKIPKDKNLEYLQSFSLMSNIFPKDCGSITECPTFMLPYTQLKELIPFQIKLSFLIRCTY
jgi:hypothetical protein